MMRLILEIGQTRVIPLTCTDCTQGWFCWGPNLLQVLEKVVDYAAPLPPNIPHHTNNESHLSCQHWHRSWSTNPSAHIPRRYSHEGWVTLTICRRTCTWSPTTIVNDLFIFTFSSSAEFLYLLVAVFTDTSSVIYWRKNAIRKLNVINQRCQFLAHIVITKMKLVFIVPSLVSVTFFTKNLTSFGKC